MRSQELYKILMHSFKMMLDVRKIGDKVVAVKASGMQGPDFPDLGGAEVTLVARYEGVSGECSTSYPAEFKGALSQVAQFDIENNPQERSIFIATMNAVMNCYETADECVSCPDDEAKERCAQIIAANYKNVNGAVNVLLVGYQPFMLKALAEHFPLRVLDLDCAHIGNTYHGVTVEHGKDAFEDAVKWANIILCTGSTLSNGTLTDFVNLPREVTFYGTTIAGCARQIGTKRVCHFGQN